MILFVNKISITLLPLNKDKLCCEPLLMLGSNRKLEVEEGIELFHTFSVLFFLSTIVYDNK